MVILLMLGGNTLFAQNPENRTSLPDTLKILYSRLQKSNEDEEKLRINDSIRMIIDGYAASDTIFEHKFDSIRYLGQITSPDSLLKLLTWNLLLTDGTNKYYLYIIRRSSPENKGQIYRLTGEFSEKQIRTDTLYTESDWYGALYYEVRPVIAGKEVTYILLGFNFGNSPLARKIIEVLRFSEDNEIVFGMEWFLVGKVLKFRDVLEYSSSAVTTLRFANDTLIVFDHLVPFSPEFINDRRYYGPDYSYDGYEYNNGLWNIRINIDVRNKE